MTAAFSHRSDTGTYLVAPPRTGGNASQYFVLPDHSGSLATTSFKYSRTDSPLPIATTDAAQPFSISYVTEGVKLQNLLSGSLFPTESVHTRLYTQARQPELGAQLTTSLQTIADIRNATKLGAKFFQGKHEHLGDKLLSLCSISYDVGLILALAGERRDLIVAGILHNAYSTALRTGTDTVRHIVSRKFGVKVSTLIDAVSGTPQATDQQNWWDRQSAKLSSLQHADRATATLSCAIATALIESGNRYLENGETIAGWSDGGHSAHVNLLEKQLLEYRRIGVTTVIVDQFRDACAKFCALTNHQVAAVFKIQDSLEPELNASGSNSLAIPQLLRDAKAVRSAAQMSFELFERVPRKWGPSETLPLSAHQYEVGMLLALAKAPKHIVVAGMLHDVFEGYIEDDTGALRDQIERAYGPKVLSLISDVTEPPKGAAVGNWWQRKLAVLDRVRKGDTDLATLVCATKISTLAAGNKMLYMGRPVSDWSSGSLEDNLAVFNCYLQEFELKRVDPVLLEQFRAEIRIFSKGTIHRDQTKPAKPLTEAS